MLGQGEIFFKSGVIEGEKATAGKVPSGQRVAAVINATSLGLKGEEIPTLGEALFLGVDSGCGLWPGLTPWCEKQRGIPSLWEGNVDSPRSRKFSFTGESHHYRS